MIKDKKTKELALRRMLDLIAQYDNVTYNRLRRNQMAGGKKPRTDADDVYDTMQAEFSASRQDLENFADMALARGLLATIEVKGGAAPKQVLVRTHLPFEYNIEHHIV